MISIEKTIPGSFLKIVLYTSNSFKNLNDSTPTYNGRLVDIINITPVGNNQDGYPLFCYELIYK